MRLLYLPIILLFLVSCNSSSDVSMQDASADQNKDTLEMMAPDNAHSSQNSIEWEGFYAGNIPCADCEGIKTTIRLNKDNTYTGSSVYLGKNPTPFSANGSFDWTTDGSSIVLSGDAGGKRVYQVVEGGLILVNNQGKKLEGALSNKYILAKANARTKIENRRWVLTELDGTKITPDSKKIAPYFLLNSLEKSVNGTFGCNRFFGTYSVESGDSLTFSKLGTTMMACPDMTVEYQMQKILGKVDHYALKNDSVLVLGTAKSKNVAVFKWED